MEIKILEKHIEGVVVTYDLVEEALSDKDKARLDALLKKQVLSKEEVKEIHDICNYNETKSIKVSNSYNDYYEPIDIEK